MNSLRQFICWIGVPSKSRPGKVDKLPVDPATGTVCDAHDPSKWTDLSGAQAAVAAGRGHGVGFVFTPADPYFFLDIDNCLQPDNTWSPLAIELCTQFAGCFVEVSGSGRGLHVIGRYQQQPTHGCKNKELGLELYTEARFCAMTWAGCTGDPDRLAQNELELLIAQKFPQTRNSGESDSEWTTGPAPDWSGPVDDGELIMRMMASKPGAGAAFAARATLQDLLTGNTEALSRCYPDSRPEGFDRSAADAALCAHLAFWTGKDCERMDRLFRQLPLMRYKWDEQRGRHTYGVKTILNAVGNCQRVLGDRRQEQTVVQPGSPEPPREDGLRGGVQFMSVPTQIDYFRGCTYVRDTHAILLPDGDQLTSERFRVAYGGYLFAMDLSNDKTTRNAWEAFTESSGYNFPKVHEACFRPENVPGAIIEEEGRLLVNTYTPIATKARPGDITPFLVHLNKLLPVKRDQDILLAYMAALVQNPGVKFQWCPLIQGVEGNGKTFLTTAMEKTVGQKYSHRPNPEDISNKFNKWIVGKLFIAIEEVYVADRRELINVLKPLITNRRVDIQGKGADQKTGDNRANFLLTTNHKEAMPISGNDRRYAPFFTAQQQAADLQRDGMGGDYFPNLYRWADAGGWEIITHYLRNYQIPDELNPATSLHRAPETSSTVEAKKTSLGSVEQEVMDAIEEGRPGFSGGWISSLAFDRLLDEKKMAARLPRVKRKELLFNLGYIWHPALPDGRVNNEIIDAGGIAGKPKLYIKSGHLACNLMTGAEVIRHYLDSQSGRTQAALAFANVQNSS